VIDREGNDPDDSSQITYSELLKQVCKFANVLKAKGASISYTLYCKWNDCTIQVVTNISWHC